MRVFCTMHISSHLLVHTFPLHHKAHLDQLEDAIGVAEGEDSRRAVQVGRRHLGTPLVHVVLLGEGPRTAWGGRCMGGGEGAGSLGGYLNMCCYTFTCPPSHRHPDAIEHTLSSQEHSRARKGKSEGSCTGSSSSSSAVPLASASSGAGAGAGAGATGALAGTPLGLGVNLHEKMAPSLDTV